MSRRARMLGVVLATCLAGTGAAAGRACAATAPASRPETGSAAVAAVGTLRIPGAELDQHVKRALQLYRDRNRTEIDPQVEPLVRRQVLENLIRQRLMALEGRRRGVTVSDAEAEAQLRLDPAFQRDGVFNEAKFLAMRAANPDRYAQAVTSMKDVIAARKMSEQLDRETRPDDAVIRAEIDRQLTRATLEFIALPFADFHARYPEPRETDVLSAYAAHAESYRRPERATVSVILVDRPAMSDSSGAVDERVRAWERHMRARADSALAAIQAGARFSDVALLYGGMRVGIPIGRDLLPPFWRGSRAELEAIFTAPIGSVLPAPVRARGGWALVRVDAITPSHIAPLREVSKEIRRDLRANARAGLEDRELRRIYGMVRDSLRGDAFRVRYALADSASFAPGEPTPAVLDRYYRAHLADYSSYDQASGSVVERPLAAVREEIRERWMRERRRQLTREGAEGLLEAWSRGRRDAALERRMTRIREVGPFPAGAQVDTGEVDRALGDALTKRAGRTGVELVPTARGYLLVDLLAVIPDHVPDFSQARPLLAQRLEALRSGEDEAAARAGFDRDPVPYLLPGMMSFSRVIVEQPPVMEVPLTRDEVERFYRAHLNEYSVQELSRVRHILVMPSGPGPDADAAARREAEDILKRVRAGESFSALAAESSDDEGTRDSGGDVGVFKRGQMKEGFENAAFAMRPGDITGPVRSEAGYHVMECLEYLPPTIHPLREVYANVAQACALAKSKRMAAARADSLHRTLRSVADAKAMAKRLHLETIVSDHQMGRFWDYDGQIRPYMIKLETLKPRQLYPGAVVQDGVGAVISWVDTILPARPPTWEEAKRQVLDAYRRDAARRATSAKRAELDSMAAAGWSFDSLATLWGGVQKVAEAPSGSDLQGLGGKALLDSLVFGRERAPLLEPGQLSEWLEFPGALTRLRIAERIPPDPLEFARRVELRRQVILWRKLNAYFDGLKRRYPVQIFDIELRTTELTEPVEP